MCNVPHTYGLIYTWNETNLKSIWIIRWIQIIAEWLELNVERITAVNTYSSIDNKLMRVCDDSLANAFQVVCEVLGVTAMGGGWRHTRICSHGCSMCCGQPQPRTLWRPPKTRQKFNLTCSNRQHASIRHACATDQKRAFHYAAKCILT